MISHDRLCDCASAVYGLVLAAGTGNWTPLRLDGFSTAEVAEAVEFLARFGLIEVQK